MARKQKEPTVSPDLAILREARERYKAASDAEAQQRLQMLDDQRFMSGDQWPEQIKQRRESTTNQGGPRPCLVINKLTQYKHQVLNDIRQNNPSIRVRPVDDNSDVEVAEILQGLIRHIEDASNADVAYETAVDNAVTSGLGYFRICTDWTSLDQWSQEITIKRIPNPFSVYLDCNSTEPDGSDANWALVCDMVPESEFTSLWPDADPSSWEADSLGDEKQNWVESDGKNKKYRVAEYFRKVPVKDSLLLLSDGTVCLRSSLNGKMPPQAVSIVKERQTTRHKVEWFKLSGFQVLERGEFPGECIPIIPVIGEEVWVGAKRILQGIVRQAKDPQRMYNYMRSAAVERIALTPKSPYIAAEGQLEGYENEWERANTDNISVLQYRPVSLNGQPVPAPMRVPAPDVPMGFVEEANRAEQDIQTTLGIYNAGLGAPSNEKSGKAIFLRQREADVATFHFVDNLSRSIRHAGRIIVDIIPKIYDTQRVARIIGEDGSVTTARINPEQEEPITGYMDHETGEIVKIYNPGVGKYDVSVSVGPSYTTKRQEAADAMMGVVQAVPNLFPMVGDLLVKNMDWPGADDIAKRLRKMLPPQLQDSDDEGGRDSAMAQQVQQLMQAAEAKIRALTAELQQAQSDRAIKVAELELKDKDINARLEVARMNAVKDVELARLNRRADDLEKLASEYESMKMDGEITADLLLSLNGRLAAIEGVESEEHGRDFGPTA